MATKRCNECSRLKPLGEFHRDAKLKTGRRGRCKACERARHRRYYAKNAEREKARPRRWTKANQNTVNARSRASEHEKVRSVLHRALRKGEVVRPHHCEGCGAEAFVHGHHEDYSQPLAVEWLCTTCHGLRHRAVDDRDPNHSEYDDKAVGSVTP